MSLAGRLTALPRGRRDDYALCPEDGFWFRPSYTEGRCPLCGTVAPGGAPPVPLLQRLDRASMAHSLEARVPFLSHNFVDWALTVPTDLKLRGKVGKFVLRQAVKPWLPKQVPGSRKLGFQMPLADWFVGGFSDFAYEAWTSSGAADAGYLDPEAVKSLFEEHRQGRANHGRLLYALAMFSCWWREQRLASSPESVPARVHA